jgi:thiol:disulfide interchange protein DsbD
VFSKAEFKKLLGAYSLVQLYTDIVPTEFYAPALRDKLGNSSDRQSEDAKANLRFQSEAFGTSQLPLYVILEPLPDGKVKVVGKYDEGKINDEAAFAKFLKDPLATSGPGLQARASMD